MVSLNSPEIPDDILKRNQEDNEASYDKYGAHYKSREDIPGLQEEESGRNIVNTKEYKPEIPTVTVVGEKVNIEINKFVNNPDLIAKLYYEGKKVLEDTKEPFNNKNLKLFIAKKLASAYNGHSAAIEKDNEKFERTYNNINFSGIRNAINAYKPTYLQDKDVDETETIKEPDGFNEQLERYRRMTKEKILDLRKVARQALRTPDKDEREQIEASIVLMEKVLSEKK